MAGRVNIKDPQRLGDFRVALGRFRERTLQALRTSERGLVDAQTRLEERHGHWQREVELRKQAMEEARRALEACRSAPHDRDERPPDCSSEARDLARAKEELATGVKNLTTVQTYQRHLQEAAERYRRQANAARQVVESQSKKAEAALADAQAALEAYERVTIISAVLGVGMALTMAKVLYKSARNQIGSAAVRHAKAQEIALVQATKQGTRTWRKSELKLLKDGKFPTGYHGHHINNVARFPDLAANPDNIRFVRPWEHKALHQGSYRNNSSGKMFNRKSLMKQWASKP